MGSGTTAIAALQENRQYIGIEIEEKYVRLARSKIASGTQIKLIADKKHPLEP
jgi:DNA modification methylase